jgi:uncharacterized protein
LSFAARALLFAVRVYQAFFSALMPSACKFYPSCSHYAAEAVRVHGARRGFWLALRRISRCHPFTPGGVDLVPDAADLPRGAPRSRTGDALSRIFAHHDQRHHHRRHFQQDHRSENSPTEIRTPKEVRS